MRNKELKMKLGQLQQEISKASLPVSCEKCFICFISDCPNYILHYNSKVRTYHCSTCVEYICFYQNCTESVAQLFKHIENAV